jgi:hypothetical protein
MRSTAPRSAAISDRTTTGTDVAGGIGYRIRLGDDEDVLRRRTLTGAIAAHLLKAASTTPDA